VALTLFVVIPVIVMSNNIVCVVPAPKLAWTFAVKSSCTIAVICSPELVYVPVVASVVRVAFTVRPPVIAVMDAAAILTSDQWTSTIALRNTREDVSGTVMVVEANERNVALATLAVAIGPIPHTVVLTFVAMHYLIPRA
jgi:hypothetical protein